jgi:hypothetical protein
MQHKNNNFIGKARNYGHFNGFLLHSTATQASRPSHFSH